MTPYSLKMVQRLAHHSCFGDNSALRWPSLEHRLSAVGIEMTPVERSYAWGIVLLILASLLWSLNGALIKLIYEGGQGADPVAIAFYRSLFAGLFLLPLVRGKWRTLGGSKDGRSLRDIRPTAVWCVVFFTLMTACFVIANTKTEAANAIILQYTSTFWIFALSPWLLRERACAGDLWILGLAMVGIAIIFAGNASTDLVGLTIALASGLFFGMLTMMIRRLRDSDSAALTVFNNLGSAVLLLPIAWGMGSLLLSSRALLLLVLMGIVQFGTPYYLYTLGLARVPAYQASLITMLEPVLVPVWTYMAVGERVPPTTLIGGAVILTSLVLFVLAAQRTRIRTGGEIL